MPPTASPEILARVKESFEWWNGGEPELMVDEYAEDGEHLYTLRARDSKIVRCQMFPTVQAAKDFAATSSTT